MQYIIYLNFLSHSVPIDKKHINITIENIIISTKALIIFIYIILSINCLINSIIFSIKKCPPGTPFNHLTLISQKSILYF